MGLFRFNYDKPGKGVDKDAPEKKGFFLYWELIFDRISKHLSLNLFWALLSLIWIVVLYMFAPLDITWLEDIAKATAEQIGTDAQTLSSTLSLVIRIMFVTEIILLWGSGPASAMYAYVARCFTRRDPVWIVSDGFDKFKENFKQSFILMILDFVLLWLGSNAILFYYNLYMQSHNAIWMFICSVTAMVAVLYTWAHFYIYQFMVTFEGSLFSHLKNSMLFAIANLPMNLFCSIIVIGFSGALYVFLNPIAALLINLIISPMFLRFMIEFTAARKIKRTVMPEEEKPLARITYLNDEGNENE